MGFLRRQQAKPAEPVTSHAVDLADSSDNESDSGSDASCSAPQSSTGIYNDKKTLRSSESDWTCTVQPSRRGFFLRASASIALPLPVEAAFGLFFGGNILPWRHFEVMSLSWAQDASWECPPWRHSHSLPRNPQRGPGLCRVLARLLGAGQGVGRGVPGGAHGGARKQRAAAVAVALQIMKQPHAALTRPALRQRLRACPALPVAPYRCM